MARVQYIIVSALLTSWTVAFMILIEYGGEPWSKPILLALLGVIILGFLVFRKLKKMGVWVRTKEAGSKAANAVQVFAIFTSMNLAPYYSQFKLISVVCVIFFFGLNIIRTYRANFLTKT